MSKVVRHEVRDFPAARDLPRPVSPEPASEASQARSVLFILYVRDQAASAAFYRAVLKRTPSLDVPGMTEFEVGAQARLGLMPEAGIRRLLGEAVPDPGRASGIPRSEVYLVVRDPSEYHRRAIEAGAAELSPVALRGWGDDVGYSLDPDGHVLAFARPS